MLEINAGILFQNLESVMKSVYFQILLIIIAFDILTGYLKAFKLKKYNSTIGINGLLRHFVVVLVMATIGVYARALNQLNISIGICMFFIANYALSLVENWGELGLPLPSWVKVYFEKMKDDTDKLIKK